MVCLLVFWQRQSRVQDAPRHTSTAEVKQKNGIRRKCVATQNCLSLAPKRPRNDTVRQVPRDMLNRRAPNCAAYRCSLLVPPRCCFKFPDGFVHFSLTCKVHHQSAPASYRDVSPCTCAPDETVNITFPMLTQHHHHRIFAQFPRTRRAANQPSVRQQYEQIRLSRVRTLNTPLLLQR